MIIFKIHILYWVMAFVCAFSGLFKNFLYFTLLIVIHELGHFLAAKMFKWKVNDFLSKSLLEEFIILLLGPLFQIIFYSIYIKIFGFNEILRNYHYSLLIFNMLPIFPLDGFKLLNIVINKFFSFKKSHLIAIITSIITLIIFIYILIFYKFGFIMFLATIFLLYKNIEEFLNHDFIFNKFLLERYIYNINLKKVKIIKSNKLEKMKREYKHIFYYNKKYETEKNILKKKFDIKSKPC